MNFRIAHVNPDKKLIILYKIHELIQKTLVFPNGHTEIVKILAPFPKLHFISEFQSRVNDK